MVVASRIELLIEDVMALLRGNGISMTILLGRGPPGSGSDESQLAWPALFRYVRFYSLLGPEVSRLPHYIARLYAVTHTCDEHAPIGSYHDFGGNGYQ